MQLQINLTLLLLLLSCAAFSQSGIKGIIYNELGKPQSQVSITIIEVSSNLKKSLSSGPDGRFFIELPQGNYNLKFSFQGYQTKEIRDQKVAKEILELQSIQLQVSLQELEAISIKGQRKLIEQQSDRMIVNVENSMLSDGLTALEVLQRAPGVKVDDEGNINMRGKSDVAVMLNGRITYLSNQELTTLLRGTNSSNIKRIELITNPSAKYDAQGLGGMINIVMKHERKSGINLAVNSFGGAGRKARYGTGILLNSQRNKWNFIAGFDKAFRGEKEYRDFNRSFQGDLNNPQNRLSKQFSTTSEPLNTNNAKAGIDFQANENLLFGLLWTGNFGTYENYSTGYNDVLLANNQALIHTLTDNSNISKWASNGINFSAQQYIGKKKNLLTAAFDFLHSEGHADQKLVSDFQKTNYQQPYRSERRNNTPSLTRLYIANLDYEQHLDSLSKLEFGLKASFMNADNEAISDTLKNQNWINDLGNSNHFLYNEQIQAAYLNYHLENEYWNFTAGLRVEHTSSFANQLSLKDPKKRSYTQLFPSASVRYKISEDQNVQLSYSRRINRPDYDDLNPFRFYVDPFVYYEGNPNLQPELANSFELNYSPKSNLHLSLFFTDVDEVMTSVLTQIPERNITIRSYQNIAGFRNMGLNINHSYTPIQAWTSINNLMLFENYYFGEFNNEKIDNKQWSFSMQSNNSIAFGSNWSAEVNAQYESPQRAGVFRQLASGFVSAGIMKKLWQDKLSLKFMVNDIFKTMRYHTESNVGNVQMNQKFNLDSRTFLFSLNFKIGKASGFQRKERKSNEEQSRVGSGN